MKVLNVPSNEVAATLFYNLLVIMETLNSLHSITYFNQHSHPQSLPNFRTSNDIPIQFNDILPYPWPFERVRELKSEEGRERERCGLFFLSDI